MNVPRMQSGVTARSQCASGLSKIFVILIGSGAKIGGRLPRERFSASLFLEGVPRTSSIFTPGVM